MTTLANGSPSKIEHCDFFVLEAEQCSVCGRSFPNEDYALFDQNIGICVADGIGGAPLGDAVARYACHVAMNIMREGGTARDAVIGAGNRVRQFVTTVDSPNSGASIVVARLNGNTLDVSWAGNTAVFVLDRDNSFPAVKSTLECGKPDSEIPLCGGPQAQPGVLSKTIVDGETILLCTDGTWREIDRETIDNIVLGDGSLREAVARIVLDKQPKDDSTAIVARVHTRDNTTRLRRRIN